MFENIKKWFKKAGKNEVKDETVTSKEAAKERLHLVLVQDRVNVSVDFLELMKQEIIDVIKKYVDVDEKAIEVSFTNTENKDGTNGTPALYANIPILNIKNEARKIEGSSTEEKEKEIKEEQVKQEISEEKQDEMTQQEKKEIKKKEENQKDQKEENKEQKEKNQEENKQIEREGGKEQVETQEVEDKKEQTKEEKQNIISNE